VHVPIFRFGALSTGCLMMIRPGCGRKADCERRNAEDRRTAVIGWLTVEITSLLSSRSQELSDTGSTAPACTVPFPTWDLSRLHMFDVLTAHTHHVDVCVSHCDRDRLFDNSPVFVMRDFSWMFVARSYRRVKEFILSPPRPYLSTLQ
jgi:hypothetical protein